MAAYDLEERSAADGHCGSSEPVRATTGSWLRAMNSRPNPVLRGAGVRRAGKKMTILSRPSALGARPDSVAMYAKCQRVRFCSEPIPSAFDTELPKLSSTCQWRCRQAR
jgi:hypothetical protein